MLIVLSCLLSLGMGTVSIEIKQLFAIILKPLGWNNPNVEFNEMQESVFWTLRLPRILFGLVVGIALGSSGVALQAIFRNPLVDAGLIGISSGASLFTSAYIILSSYSITFFGIPLFVGGTQLLFSMPIVAFLGAALTAFMVYRISLFQGRINITILILAGVALNALSGSLTGLLTFFADDKQLRDMTFWTLGSLSSGSWTNLYILLPFVFIPFFILMRSTKALNAFALGENPAHFLGVNIKRTKTIVLLCSTAMVGACVAFTGVIGFVGLVIPHILRLIIGPNHNALMPLSTLAGALLVCLADLTSRTLLPPTEIPIGIITSLIGTPVLLVIILRQKRSLFI